MTPLHRNLPLFISHIFIIIFTCLIHHGNSYSGLLTSTLQTFPGSACEGEKLYLRCPNRTMISIQSAQYGRQVPSYRMCPPKTNQSHLSEYSFWNFREDTNCLATSSLMVLFDKCQNKNRCLVVASTSTFRQDPCPGTSKYLSVAYKCIPNITVSNETVCDGEQLTLSCLRSNRIAIHSALFGRKPQDSTKCSSSLPSYADCSSASALEEVMRRCHGRKRCAVEAEEYVFGNPCPPGIKKYLSVSYSCVPRKILKEVDRHKGRHRNRKRKKKKKDETTTEDNINIQPVTTADKVLDKVTKSPPDMYAADDADAKQTNKNINKEPDKGSGNKIKKDGYSIEEENNSSVLCINDTVPGTPVGRSRDGAKGLIIDWFSSFYFVRQNREKAALYLVLGICMGIICLLIIVIIKLIIRGKRKEKTKLDVTDPVNSNVIPPPSHIESPTLTRTESVDRIEVVRFEPRSSTSNGFHPHYNLRADYDNTLRTDYDRNSLLRMNYDRNPLSSEERHPLRTDFDRNTIRTDYDRETLRSQYEATRNTLRSVNFQTQAHGTLNTLNSDHGDRSLNNYYG